MDKFKKGERRHVPGIVLPFLVRELMQTLTPAEFMAWSAFYLHANRENVCCLKNETVIRECGFTKNTFHRSKSGLVKKCWLVPLGQRGGRGPGVYKTAIPLPRSVETFLNALWDVISKESWWDDRLGEDKFDYTDTQLDWLVWWRVIRALKDSDAAARAGAVDAAAWNPNDDIPPDLSRQAQQALLTILRRAGSLLSKDQGLWFLWGDGFDAAKSP
jgi:hypothetical protein